jgi:hypothetical protein
LKNLGGDVKKFRYTATGDRALTSRLDACADRGVIALFDRSVPGYTATIAAIAIGPSGVYLIDVKHCHGGGLEPEDSVSAFWNVAPKPLVSGQERTQIVLKMAWKMEVVRSVLDGLPEARVAPGQPMLALVGAKWGPFRSPVDVDGIYVAWPEKIAKVVSGHGPLSRSSVARIAERLAAELPSAKSRAAVSS